MSATAWPLVADDRDSGDPLRPVREIHALAPYGSKYVFAEVRYPTTQRGTAGAQERAANAQALAAAWNVVLCGQRGEPVYTVERDSDGCAHCAAGRSWSVVGPDGVAEGASYLREEDAAEIADALSRAFALGRSSVVTTDPGATS